MWVYFKVKKFTSSLSVVHVFYFMHEEKSDIINMYATKPFYSTLEKKI